ncbi:MAG: 50S ribosomal protein L11 methyltransferase [Novosphingobium sp.]|nr:50S ribosomal protein L11 methyltransferase [Novosphingobium sp.]
MSGTLSEHHSYLSIPGRHEAYRTAVAQVVQPGDLVADLGCGFGVLGLLCLEAGADHVWGIDSTDAIEIAAETMAREGMADRYTCIRETSFRAELPEKVDVLICDHVGYFGVDYGIVAMLEDARSRFLKPGGRVIPQALDLRIAGVSSPQARDVLGQWEKDTIPGAYSWLSDYCINSKHDVTLAAEELATRSVSLGKVDLTQDSPGMLSFTARLTAGMDHDLDARGGWFSCELAPGVTMTNAPDAVDRITRGQVLLGFETPLAVMAGDSVEVTIKVRHEDGIISWIARNPRTGQQERQSTFASLPMGAAPRSAPSQDTLSLNKAGLARTAVLALVDGKRSGEQIESEMLRSHSGLFPSQAELVRFVRAELARSTR